MKIDTRIAQPIYTPNISAPTRQDSVPQQNSAQNDSNIRVPEHISYRFSPGGLLASRVLGALNLTRNNNKTAQLNLDISGVEETKAPAECQTCQNRKYVDQSNDGSVSFQSPTQVSPEAAVSAVSAHEMEHLSNEQDNAARDGRKVVSQSITLHTSVCPECGRIYVSGGEARTTTVPEEKQEHPVIDLLNSLGNQLEN